MNFQDFYIQNKRWKSDYISFKILMSRHTKKDIQKILTQIL